MDARTNTAKWNEKVQDGELTFKKMVYVKVFTVQREETDKRSKQKADEWLDDNLINQNIKVSKLYIEYIKEKELNVGTSRYKNIQSIFNKWILTNIGNINVSNLTEQNLQDILNKQYKKGLVV